MVLRELDIHIQNNQKYFIYKQKSSKIGFKMLAKVYEF